MKQKKIYIAGAVRGLPDEQVQAKFRRKSEELEAQGNKVINPVLEVYLENQRRQYGGGLLPILNDGVTRDQTIRFCIGLLIECDELHLLPCWQDSEGARLERDLAMRLNMPIVYA